MSVTLMLGGNVDAIKPALDCAIHLTKRLQSTLTGLCALPDPVTSSVYITGAETVVLGSAAIASLTQAQDKLMADFSQAFSTQTKAAGPWLKAEFHKEIGSVAAHAVAAATLDDAFILPNEATRSSHALNPAFEQVLMEAHLPLVLAPQQMTPSDTCVIAWDGSPISARAVRLHLPLIRTYQHVVLAQNTRKVRHQWDHVCQSSKQRVIDLLHDERLNVTPMEMSGAVSEGLLKTAEEHGASLIVMGAYGHNRIGQMLFGGTTSKLLHNAAAPALALCR
ncbi:MAG: universal stress protein [Pseudomonadota bacterium]